MKEDVVSRIEKGMLKWFGHIDVDGRVGKYRPQQKYLNQIEDDFRKGQLRIIIKPI